MLQISQKTFLWTALAALVLVSATLFTLHDRALDPEVSGDWWAVRFVEPDDPHSLAFEVENHTATTRGSYAVYIGGTLREMQDIDVSNPLTQFQIAPPATADAALRSRIVVVIGGEERSLTR